MLISKKIIISASLVGIAIVSGVLFSVVTREVDAQVFTATSNSTSTGPNIPQMMMEAQSHLLPDSDTRHADYFLQIEGVDGTTQEIEVLSWSWGASNPTSVGSSGMSAGKVSFSDLSVMKMVDKSSPLLHKALATGQHIKQATLTVRVSMPPNSDGTVSPPEIAAKYTFKEVMVSSISDSGWTGGMPMEMVTFSPKVVTVEVKGQPSVATYDLKANKK
jgi:type VI secretion system secreted protein Hcp